LTYCIFFYIYIYYTLIFACRKVNLLIVYSETYNTYFINKDVTSFKLFWSGEGNATRVLFQLYLYIVHKIYSCTVHSFELLALRWKRNPCTRTSFHQRYTVPYTTVLAIPLLHLAHSTTINTVDREQLFSTKCTLQKLYSHMRVHVRTWNIRF
jgi:hypothetical protein